MEYTQTHLADAYFGYSDISEVADDDPVETAVEAFLTRKVRIAKNGKSRVLPLRILINASHFGHLENYLLESAYKGDFIYATESIVQTVSRGLALRGYSLEVLTPATKLITEA